jgi:hypothetical protein
MNLIGYFSFYLFFILFLFLCGTIQGLVLARQVLYHLSYLTSPFCFGYFGDKVSLYPWGSQDWDRLVCASP